MLDHATGQPGTHTHIDRGYDFYETPNVAVDALLRVEWLPRQPQRIWEPVAGNGAIAKVLRESGYDVVASDVVEREFKRDFVAGFLTTPVPEGAEANHAKAIALEARRPVHPCRCIIGRRFLKTRTVRRLPLSRMSLRRSDSGRRRSRCSDDQNLQRTKNGDARTWMACSAAESRLSRLEKRSSAT